MEDLEIGIQVVLAGKQFKMKINSEDEKKYRIAARQLNEKVMEYQAKMNDEELLMEDILRMVAFDFACKLETKEL